MRNKIVKIMFFLSLFVMSSCANNEEIMKYSPNDKWDITNIEYNFSYSLEFIDINSNGFELKIINNSSEDLNYNLVLSAIIDVDNIIVNEEIINISAGGVVPISYCDIPEFKNELIINFHFKEPQNYKKISTSFTSMFINYEGILPKYGIGIDLYKY